MALQGKQHILHASQVTADLVSMYRAFDSVDTGQPEMISDKKWCNP